MSRNDHRIVQSSGCFYNMLYSFVYLATSKVNFETATFLCALPLTRRTKMITQTPRRKEQSFNNREVKVMKVFLKSTLAALMICALASIAVLAAAKDKVKTETVTFTSDVMVNGTLL